MFYDSKSSVSFAGDGYSFSNKRVNVECGMSQPSHQKKREAKRAKYNTVLGKQETFATLIFHNSNRNEWDDGKMALLCSTEEKPTFRSV